ncbi:MAG: hypothetical protein J7641_02180 [Cyanobacteria bacterium SID2]|nr:hypothetical protein [Cyanobacteria bacterium SID2]MBP0002547.1 hypothetical protein [Cyanobacteria bacterium SBC]
MNVRWKVFILKSTLWLASEVVLTIAGMDDLADYSEFVFERYLIAPKVENYSNSKGLNDMMSTLNLERGRF